LNASLLTPVVPTTSPLAMNAQAIPAVNPSTPAFTGSIRGHSCPTERQRQANCLHKK